ncbi:MAG: hypothetical protein RMK98_08055 [Bacteroidia bacterium]|nr:hypothetical protein [Bacteroidia bacterium]
MGSAVAALGLLTACHLDNDQSFFPRPVGVYLRIQRQLFWAPEGGTPILLAQNIRRICGTENRLLLLHEGRDSISVMEVGTHRHLHHFKLQDATAITEGKKQAYLGYAGGVCVYEDDRKGHTLRCGSLPLPAGAGRELIYAHPYLVGTGRDSLWVVRLTSDKKGVVTNILPLRGQVEALWNELSGSIAGVTRIGDTLYGFGYSLVNRTFVLSATPTSVRKKQFSPYTQKAFGTEYLGEVALSVSGFLVPGGWDRIRDFSCDFLGGKVYCLREDSVWRYDVATGEKQFLLYSPQSREVEVVPIYRYGEAEITTR